MASRPTTGFNSSGRGHGHGHGSVSSGDEQEEGMQGRQSPLVVPLSNNFMTTTTTITARRKGSSTDDDDDESLEEGMIIDQDVRVKPTAAAKTSSV